MNRKVLLIVLGLTLIMICTIISPTFAVVFAPAPSTYTEITGKLGGANYLLRIPDNWNGGLVVLCRGYSHLMSGVNITANAENSKWVTNKGYALAVSDFGAAGFCIQKAMIRVHQLTEYVIDNYDVTGNVFLIGVSMGGVVALELGAKYPTLYDGVIHMSGPTDTVANYETKLSYANIPDDSALESILIANGGIPPPFPCPTIAVFRNLCASISSDIAIECGGTPEEKPKAYERISPIESATDITIPTITVHGTADSLYHYSQALEFYNAVNDAGHSDLYRFYKVVGGKHCDPPVSVQMIFRFDQLVQWVDQGIPAPASIT